MANRYQRLALDPKAYIAKGEKFLKHVGKFSNQVSHMREGVKNYPPQPDSKQIPRVDVPFPQNPGRTRSFPTI
jgi:hypothetical protein